MEEDIITAWNDLLDGNISVPVFRTNVATRYNGHYVLLRKESGSYDWNKGGFFRHFTLIVEIVTKFGTIINDKLVDDIDTEIKGLIFNSPASINLNVVGLVKVDPGIPTYIDEDNGSIKIYRKITRFTHQTASAVA